MSDKARILMISMQYQAVMSIRKIPIGGIIT